MVPISWFILSDGGYAPLTFTIYKRTGNAEFYVVSENIPNYAREGQTIIFDVVGLQPQTLYDFRVQAKNSRDRDALSGNISNSGDTTGGIPDFATFVEILRNVTFFYLKNFILGLLPNLRFYYAIH